MSKTPVVNERSEKPTDDWPPPGSNRWYSNISKNHYDRLIKLERDISKLTRPHTHGYWFCRRKWCSCGWLKTLTDVHDCNYPDPEGLETFLASVESVYELRKKKLHTEASAASAEYLMGKNPWKKESYLRYFVGHILWTVYYEHPRLIPTQHRDGRDFNGAIDGIITLQDSDIVKMIPEIRSLVCFRWHYYGGGNGFITLGDKTCDPLCAKVMQLISKKKLFNSKDTIAIQVEQAKNDDQYSRAGRLKSALKPAQEIYGRDHSKTLEIHHSIIDALNLEHKFEESQRHLEKLIQDQQSRLMLNHEEVRTESIPALVEVHLKQGRDLQGRELLWSVAEDQAQALYKQHWPFTWKSQSRSSKLIKMAHQVGGGPQKRYWYFSDLALIIFPFENIIFTAVEPSDEEKVNTWQPLLALPYDGSKAEPSSFRYIEPSFKYSIRKDQNNSMVLEVPYISYQHYQQSEYFRNGRLYNDYRKASTEFEVLGDWLTKHANKFTLGYITDSYVEGWPDGDGRMVEPLYSHKVNRKREWRARWDGVMVVATKGERLEERYVKPCMSLDTPRDIIQFQDYEVRTGYRFLIL